METQAKKKILIVEDEALLTEMYAQVFEKEGFQVVPATTGQEALKAAACAKPDLILLDILLPGDSGISFLEQRRQDPAVAHIPVIAFSNFDDPHTKERALALGARDYLIKTNYTPQEVVEKVKRCLYA